MQVHRLDTPEAQARGVIGRTSLEPDEVFVFPDLDPAATYFHMQGVPFDLEIAFLDAEFLVLRVDRMGAEDGWSRPPLAARIAVEARPGFFSARGVRPGTEWDELKRRLAGGR